MRRLLALLLVLGLAVFSANVVYAQGSSDSTEQVESSEDSGYQVLKKQ